MNGPLAPDAFGIVLAGGRGARLGLGSPMATAVLGGRTLLERAVDRMASVSGVVAVVAAPSIALPSTRAERVPDVPGFRGPLAGLVAGLGAAARAGRARALVLGVDFPFARAEALLGLVTRLGERQAVVPAPGGVWQPLVAAYAVAAAGPLEALLRSGVRSVIEAVNALGPRVLAEDELLALPGGLDNFFNVNTKDELDEAARRLAATEGP
jgi:molybdopterin-guanine dinucleotide biosynthesis protein A